MPLFRCEFEVTGDLVLPGTDTQLVSADTAGNQFTFRNGKISDKGHPIDLAVTVIGNSESMENAEHDLREALLTYLNLLAFTTHSRFRLERTVQLIEWEPGKRQRQMWAFHKTDPRMPPSPDLIDKYTRTVEALDGVSPAPFIRTALRYFRYAMVSPIHEDQFMNFWLALEIVAENSKDKEKVPIPCANCGKDMVCESCGDRPLRTPMAKQAIESAIERNAEPGKASDVKKLLFAARNGIMHGRGIQSVERECGKSFPEVVNTLGMVAWHAIFRAFPQVSGNAQLEIGHWGGAFASTVVIAAVKVTFDHEGPGQQPAEDKIPRATIALKTRFGGSGSAAPEGNQSKKA